MAGASGGMVKAKLLNRVSDVSSSYSSYNYLMWACADRRHCKCITSSVSSVTLTCTSGGRGVIKGATANASATRYGADLRVVLCRCACVCMSMYEYV